MTLVTDLAWHAILRIKKCINFVMDAVDDGTLWCNRWRNGEQLAQKLSYASTLPRLIS